MAVKQIQLRGISRTPSDRMTRDGGLAESLNMQLDGEELAPMRLPDDVTSELLGEWSLSGREKVLFIHEGVGYTNYIIEDQGGIYALIHDVDYPQLLEEGALKSAKNLGNMLVLLLESGSVSYVLFDVDHYLHLSTKSLDLEGEFSVVTPPNADYYKTFLPDEPTDPYEHEIWDFDIPAWHNVLTTPEASLDDSEKKQLALIREYEARMWGCLSELNEANRERGAFSNPVLARYGVRILDGGYAFLSEPVLLGSGAQDTIVQPYHNGHAYGMGIAQPWEGGLSFGKTIPAAWRDLIVSVDIFLSEDIIYPQFDSRIVDATAYGIIFEGEQVSKKDAAAKAAFLSATNFYRIASLSVDDMDRLGTMTAYNLLTEKMNGKQDYRVTQPRLADISRFDLVPNGLLAYNGRLIAAGASYALESRYHYMFGPSSVSNASHHLSYKLRFFINKEGMEYTVDVDKGGIFDISSSSASHGWAAVFFPDVDCKRLELLQNNAVLYTVPMQEHPSLNCSFAFLGFGVNVDSLTHVSASSFTSVAGNVVSVPNKLFMTRTDNPFVYELGNTQTFDDDIIDAATIAKALITNPYGLADIYVFTKGGIYSIGLMRDGSFNNIYPYTRDVLIPGTLAMIDHAVVFTTEKGVMLLSESGLQDISQVMRGKHDPLPAAAASLLNGDEQYRSLVPAATATEPFMAFMKGARAAYDYAGKRLLFFNDNYLYQYVFMLETATWHKTDMVGADSYTILNSHPQCLVAATAQAKTLLLLTSISDYPADVDTVARIIAAAAPSSAGLVWRDISADIIEMGLPWTCDVTGWPQESLDTIDNDIDQAGLGSVDYENVNGYSAVMDLSTLLDDGDYIAETGHEVKGLVVTRPLAFDAPDIRKVLKDLRIRTQANRTDVKYILLASMDGKTWKRLTSRGGGSFKWFKIVLVTSLSPIERIGWLDVDVQTRYMDKLR